MTDYENTAKNAIRLKYKLDTGQDETTTKLHVYRSKGRWIIDLGDVAMLKLFGTNGVVEIPDQDYLIWLEEMVNDLM